MNPSIDPLSQLLGEISAKLDTVTKTQGEDRVASATYRTDVRSELTKLTAGVTDLKNRIDNTVDEVAELRPDVEDYRRRRDQAEGASKLTKVLWAVFTALGGGGVIAIIEMLRSRGR